MYDPILIFFTRCLLNMILFSYFRLFEAVLGSFRLIFKTLGSHITIFSCTDPIFFAFRTAKESAMVVTFADVVMPFFTLRSQSAARNSDFNSIKKETTK